MFLLIATTYWVGFRRTRADAGAASVWRGDPDGAAGADATGLLFVGMIWRDVLLAGVLAPRRRLAFAAAGRRKIRVCGAGGRDRAAGVRRPAAAECAFAAPILGAYIAWPTAFYWKRTAVILVPAMALFFVLIQLVYYGALGATRQTVHCKRSWCSTSAVSATSPGRTSFLLPGVHPSWRSF